MQQVDFLEIALFKLQNKLINDHQAHLKTLNAKLFGLTPQHHIRELQNQTNLQAQHLKNRIQSLLQQQQQQLGNLAGKLDGLSPLATLKRGYAIATKNQKVLRSADEANSGDKINIKLMTGELDCVVE